jgi:hypothetical protein
MYMLPLYHHIQIFIRIPYDMKMMRELFSQSVLAKLNMPSVINQCTILQSFDGRSVIK